MHEAKSGKDSTHGGRGGHTYDRGDRGRRGWMQDADSPINESPCNRLNLMTKRQTRPRCTLAGMVRRTYPHPHIDGLKADSSPQLSESGQII